MNTQTDQKELNKLEETKELCPHCGGTMETSYDNSDDYEVYYIDYCTDCGYKELA